MKIPKQVQIAGRNYRVYFDKKISHSEKTYGRIYHDELKIVLDNQQPMEKERIEEAFLHECLHGVCGVANIDLSEENIYRMSELLYQVIKQLEGK